MAMIATLKNNEIKSLKASTCLRVHLDCDRRIDLSLKASKSQSTTLSERRFTCLIKTTCNNYEHSNS